jgi:acetyl-CoA C-acetyltransferase
LVKAGKPLASIISAGCSVYGRRDGLFARELLNEALSELFSNEPKLKTGDVDAFYLGQAFESFEHQANTAAAISNNFGFSNIPSCRIESVSSSGGSALRQGILGLLSKQYNVVICAGAEKMTLKPTSEAIEIISMAADRPFEQWNGATLTSLNALGARSHMQNFGTTEEQMALVAVKNHKNAVENPKAFLRKTISVGEVLSSRNISTPLKLLDCSPICDGASCIALCQPELATRLTEDPIDIIGSSEASDCDFVFRSEYTSFKSTQIASRKAYDMSGFKPSDLDFAEIHDAFTINEIIACEDLGFCERGQGGALVESGDTGISGSLPVNPSGGLKAKGHPVGSSGIGQVYEVYSQFKGKAAASRKVRAPKVALTHSMGGAGVTVQVHVYRRRSAA